MSQKTYHIGNAAEFLGNNWPLPANSLVYWSQQQAGGVLLFEGTHYTIFEKSFVLAIPLQDGDLISVVTFP
jgi:hypothetical protein